MCNGFSPNHEYTKTFNAARACRRGTNILSIVKHPRRLQAQQHGPTDFDSEAVLKFSAASHHSTKPVRVKISACSTRTNICDTLQDFFHNDKHRDCLLIGSGNTNCHEPTMEYNTKSLLQKRWEKESAHFKDNIAFPPSNEESCKTLELRVRTGFLAFTIYAIAILGVQLVQKEIQGQDNDQDFSIENEAVPEYQFVLLEEDFTAEGPPPLVWIFNQLTGKGKGQQPLLSPNTLDEPHMMHAYLEVSPYVCKVEPRTSEEESSHVEQMEVTFHAVSRVEINVSFPYLLLKILPVPKEVIERQGSLALQKNLDRDVVPGIREFRETFVTWKKQNYL